MPNKAELVKLTNLSNKGKISLNDAEGYLAKTGWKEKERNEALKYMDVVKREQDNKTPNAKNSGLRYSLIVLFLIILCAVAVYLLSIYGFIDLSRFITLMKIS